MTLDELTSKIKAYESKWGKLGHSSILRKEKGNEKSTDMNKDFYEFRKKVFNGSQSNKKAHAQMINVTDLNNRYYEEVTSNGTLIHAQSPLYGEQRENTKYYKREGDPGNYKYYYTKEEWDAAHKTDGSTTETKKESTYEVDPEDNKVVKVDSEGNTTKLPTDLNQFREGAKMEADRKIERTAKESGLSAGVKTLLKDERMSEMFDQFEGGFENHGWTLNYDGTISGMTEDDENYVKSVQDWAKKFKDSTGVDLYGSKEFQDAVTKEIQNRWEKVNGSKEKSPKATDTTKKDAVEAESVSKKQEIKGNSETVKKEGPIKKRTKDGEEIKSTETKDVKTDNVEVKTTKEKEVKTKDPETRSKEISNRLADLGKGGNVDLNNLPDVPTKFLKKAGYDEIDEGETVKTYTSTFTSDEDGSCYNFSPIMVDPKTGKFLGVMPADEFDEYCLDVVNGKRKDDHNLQIGGKFTGKDAESKAAAACQEIDKLHAESDKLNKKSDKDNSKKTSSNPKTDKTVKMYTDKVKNESPKKVAKEIYKNRDFGLDELFHEVKEAIKDGAMIWDGSDLAAVSSSKSDKKKYNKANDYVNEIYRDMAQYIDAIAEASGKNGPEVWKEFRTLMTNKFDRLSKKYAPSNKEAKHSAIEEEDMNINKVQSTNKGDEILDEYRAFKERANRGAAANRLSHSSMISAADLNARYEEEQKKQCILVHSGKNYKYYNKIDLPSGETRYFYTKAEWDAYRNNGGKQYAVNHKIDKQDSSNAANKKPGFAKGLSDKIQDAAKDISKAILNGDNIPSNQKEIIKKSYSTFEDNMKKKYRDRFRKTESSYDLPDGYPYKDNFKDMENFIESSIEKPITDVMNSYLKNDANTAYKEGVEILKNAYADIDNALEEEITKREKSIEAYNKLKDIADNKIELIYDDTKGLSKFEKQVLADEMGVDKWDIDIIAKKYGFDEDSLPKDGGDDYGAATFEKMIDAMNQFWNDYKAAKKALSSNASKAKDDED